MSTSVDELSFEADLKVVLESPAAARWTIEKVGPLELHVTLSSELAPPESFQARLLWAAYPGRAPSLKFRDPETGRLDLKTAWPKVAGFRPGNLDACVNWCAEGLTIHPEWNNDARYRWDPEGNPLMRTLVTLQTQMDISYTGRAA